MKNRQILALMLAAAVAVPSQVVTAADMAEQPVMAESVDIQTDGTEPEEPTEAADSQQPEIEIQPGAEMQQDADQEKIQVTETQNTVAASNASSADEKDKEGQKPADIVQKDSQQKLATVRVTNKDVYGIVGGKATLAGNYDQGYPAVPRDGVVWCDGNKQPLSDSEKYSTTTSTTMTLKNITADQDGQTFYLSATNAAGTAYSEAVTLHVLDASVASQNVQSGKTAILSVKLQGDWGTSVHYQWYKGDEELSGQTMSILILSNVQDEDAGEYRCVVRRGGGRADEYNSKTVSANLTVDGKLATVRAVSRDVYGFVGGKATLAGNYDQGYPAVPRDGVVWCDGSKQPLSDSEKYSTTTSTTMTLKNITADQDGQTFYLSATNAVGTAYSEPVTLHVMDAQAGDQRVQAGEDVTLKATVTGDPGNMPVRYQWYKGNEKLKGAVLSSYTVKNTQASDAGEYRCVVQRGSGSADEYNSKTVAADVYVDGLAAFVTQSHENDKILPGDKVTFHAEPEEDWGTEALYQWYDQDGKPLTDNAIYSGTTTDTLTVVAAAELDGTGYYCVISDGYRTAETELSTVEVEEKAAVVPDGGSEDGTQGGAAGNVQAGGQDDQQLSAEKIAVKGKSAEKETPRTADTASAGTWALLAGTGLLGIAEALRRRFR